MSANADAHGRARVGVFFGFPAPIYYPAPAYYYPYPRYYYPPTVVVPPPAATADYIEQNPPVAATPPAPSAPPASSAPSAPSASGSQQYWYYCADSKTYYPYVQTCPSQWQQVVPQSAPPS